jgi:hypothetical protein
VKFQFENDSFEKGLCRKCEHLYSTWLQTDLEVSAEQFGFGEENENLKTQAMLLSRLVLHRPLSSGQYLDFGVGGNLRSLELASEAHPEHRFRGCDLYPDVNRNYFTTYDTNYFGMFDGISSYAVLEHLTYPRDAWTYLNRLLKPVSRGGGIMIHSFPSQLHHVFGDWQIQIRSHTCLFSRKSLALQCKIAGFRLLLADPPQPVGTHGHPVMIFQKVRDV